MMSPDRLEELLEAYGSREDNWPEELRHAMLACLESSCETPQVLDSAQRLDARLNAYVPALPDLEQRILEAIPKTRLESFLDWLLPTLPHLWWRPTMAAAMPLLLGVAIGLGTGEDTTGVIGSLLSGDTDADWELQERSLLAPIATEDWYE